MAEQRKRGTKTMSECGIAMHGSGVAMDKSREVFLTTIFCKYLSRN